MAIIGLFAVFAFSIPTILSVSTGHLIWHLLNFITFPIGKVITNSVEFFDEEND